MKANSLHIFVIGTLFVAVLANSAAAQDALTHAARRAASAGASLSGRTYTSQAASASVIGLAAFWPFDEASGLIAGDASGNANNGTLACSGCGLLPNWVAGMRGGALNFGAPGDVVSVPDSPGLRLTNQFTIAFWLKKASGATNVTYLSKGGFTSGYFVATGNPGNYIYINLVNNGAQTARCVASGVILNQTWQHFAITDDGTTIRFYVNGVAGSTCATTGVAGTSSSPLLIGGTNQSSSTGTMDELRIYNRSLSAQEIASVYNDPGTSISLNPASVTLQGGQTQQYQATVTGLANTSVSWSISPQVGTISQAGLYTAPASINSSQTVTVTASSVLDSSKSATAAIALQSTVVQTGSTLASFSLNELFGVSWPDQPIEFRYDGGQPPANTRMIGPNGTEVPFQWVSSCSDTSATRGCIAVRSSLPANASYTWTLQSGVAPAATPVNPVQLTQVGSNYQITNGLAGIRVVTAAANPGPWNKAPLQGILMPNGAWTGAGASPNLLYAESKAVSGCIGCSMLATPMYTATGYTVSVVDSGPMKVVLKVSYTFNRPQYAAGSTVVNTAGPGHYTLIVTMYANSKSVLVDEDSDMMFSYYLPLYAQLQPNLARFRGHDSVDSTGNPNPVCGYESPLSVTAAANTAPIVITASGPASAGLANGQRVTISGVLGNTAANGFYFVKTSGYATGQFGLYSDAALTHPVAGNGTWTGGGTMKPAYRGQNITPAADAFLDLTYTGDRPASYRCDANSYRKMLTDYPAATHSAAWYAEMFNSAAGINGPVVGMYTGRASKQIFSAAGPSMPGIYSSNKHWISGTQDAGIQVDNLLRGPDGTNSPVIHRNWAIFVSTEKDLAAPGNHQPIADEQNALTGINLSRLYTYQLIYPDPVGGWQWEYLPAAGANRLISAVQNGTAICGTPTCYYSLLKNSEGSRWGGSLLNMWQGNSAAAVQAALNAVTGIAQQIVQMLAAGDNHFDGLLGYYQLGLYTSPSSTVLNAILMNPNTTPAQKTLAKAELALFGCLLWDDDWFPIDNPSGESDGLANQIQQYLQYRTQSAAAAPSQPFLATTVATAATYPASDFNSNFSSTGAAAGSTHYQSAFFEPLILNYLNFALDGTPINGMPAMSDPKWSAYANWELSIQTPPEPRFGGSTNVALGLAMRKGYSNGDGNTEADVRTGMLGTALYTVNPTLAGNLMWAWQQSNSATIVTEDSQFVTTLAAIDPTIPPIKPQLGSINVPGYHSVERHNFGTANETAVWFINGGFYSTGGHRHADDGQVSIYALSAPLAIDWNANLYYPETPGRFMHDSIVYDTELTHTWNADNPGLWDASGSMQNPTNTEFAAFGSSTAAIANFTASDGTVWTRSVRTMAFDPGYPVIYVKDTFAGPSAAAGKTLTWNLMATGTVGTPAGPVTPTTRFSAGCQTPAAQLPSDGNVYGLNAGLQQFSFTGQAWLKHAAGGINWDLFTLPTGGTEQFLIGNWGHGCHPTRESGEYQTANGKPFAETQHILRVHDTAPFTTILLPYAKTSAPVRTVTQQACGVQIVQTNGTNGAETTCFNDSAAQYSNATTSILSIYDGSAQAAFGVSASGGPQEITIQAGQITWTISGAAAGTRSLTLPGNWAPSLPLTQVGGAFTYNFPGGLQTSPVSIAFTLQ